jgi:hypothetical protein
MAQENDFFLTHLDAEFQQHTDEILANARKEHKKINDVVNFFRSKVDKMIDKQRIEYIQAYESHMQDVQRELHTLRDKVNEMANNHTKNERTEKLKAEIIQFKSDALQLETDSDYLRTVMAKTVHKIYTVEKSRDWMLRRLRRAKKEYNTLLKEKSRLLEEASFASLSHDNDSAYTFEFGDESHGGVGDGIGKGLSNKFKRNIRSHADVKRDLKLPAINTSQTKEKNGKKEPTNMRISRTKELTNTSARDVSIRSLSSMAKSIASVELGGSEDDLGKLIALRSLDAEIQQFLSQCKSSLHKRPWSKVHQRKDDELVLSCRRIVTEQLHKDTEERNSPGFLSLVCELAVLPSTYEVIMDALNEVSINPTDLVISDPAEEEEFLIYHNDILNWNVDSVQTD